MPRLNFLHIVEMILLFAIFLYFLIFLFLSSDARGAEGVGKFENVEISCHTSESNNMLPLLHKDTYMPAKSIFFHETACFGGLTGRQACVVESAARAHPQFQINVLFTSPVVKAAVHNVPLSPLLTYYTNVHFVRVNIYEFAQETPISRDVQKLNYAGLNMHISKILKYLTMYKYSGIYLGLDVIVAKSLEDLWQNWVIRQTPSMLSDAMFSFSENKVGRKLAQTALGVLKDELRNKKGGDSLIDQAPTILTRTMQHWCTSYKVERMSYPYCQDVGVYGPELFYPIVFRNRQDYFKLARNESWQDPAIYTFHVWEEFTENNLIANFSLYGKIAGKFCPVIYGHYAKTLSTWQ